MTNVRPSDYGSAHATFSKKTGSAASGNKKRKVVKRKEAKEEKHLHLGMKHLRELHEGMIDNYCKQMQGIGATVGDK